MVKYFRKLIKNPSDWLIVIKMQWNKQRSNTDFNAAVLLKVFLAIYPILQIKIFELTKGGHRNLRNIIRGERWLLSVQYIKTYQKSFFDRHDMQLTISEK